MCSPSIMDSHPKVYFPQFGLLRVTGAWFLLFDFSFGLSFLNTYLPFQTPSITPISEPNFPDRPRIDTPNPLLAMVPPSSRSTPDIAERNHVDWFVEEVAPHGNQLKAWLRNAFPSVRDVDDIVQESYIRIWRSYASQPVKFTKSLLFTIARRLALNVVRKDRRSPFLAVTDFERLSTADSTTHEAGASALGHAEEVELLAEAIDALPSRCREVFILRRLQGIPQKEIAARLGISEETVQRQAANGLRRCEQFVLRRLKDRP